MFIYTTTNILAGPLLLLIGMIDVFLLLVAFRLALGLLPHIQSHPFYHGLQRCTDPPAQAVQRYLARKKARAVPSWQPWCFVIAGCLIIRYLLAWLAVAVL